MIIKNTNPSPVSIAMTSREIHLSPGEEVVVTAEEVRDARLREKLQIRAIAIVRPTTEQEEATMRGESIPGHEPTAEMRSGELGQRAEDSEPAP